MIRIAKASWLVGVGWTASLLAPVANLDLEIQRRVQESRTPGLEAVMRSASDIGRRDIVLGILLGIAVLSGPRGPATVREVVIALVPTNLAVDGLKWATNRKRPDGSDDRKNSSFPSSHAANAFAIACVFARRWGRAAPAFLAGAGLVAFSRMYLNRHFMSDVLAGAIIGSVMAYLAGRVVLWASRRAQRSRKGEAALTV